MKIVIFSDSHGKTMPMLKAVESHCPDMVLHLGDHDKDAQVIIENFPQVKVHTVCGNCDYNSVSQVEKTLEIAGRRIVMVHGHMYGVKQGLEKLIAMGQAKGAGLLLFGHTHIAYHAVEGNMEICNPGSIFCEKNPSFATVQMEGNVLTCKHIFF